MGFVKSAEEIERIEAALVEPRFGGGQMLAVEFLSDPDFIAAVLPPPLEPLEEPRMRAMVGRWESNCCGDFAGGTVYIMVRHEGVEGDYNLAQFMDKDSPTLYGRDLFGEPKKVGRAELMRRGDHVRGSIERGGIRLVELEGEMKTDLGPFEDAGYNFNFKARPSATGRGLEEDAVLTRARFEISARTSLEGEGRMTLRGGVHDPLDEIPVTEIIRATYLECDLVASCEPVGNSPAAVHAPYHHGHQDDWSQMDTEAGRVAA
jgi:acetoacetate decarboxylase